MEYASALLSYRIIVLMLLSIPAYGMQSISELDERLHHCANLADADDRLSCFETLAEQRFEFLDRPHPTAPTSPVAEETPSEEAITAKIDRVEERIHGERIFYLSNGQVWEEVNAGRGRYPTNTPVRIERAALGSFLLRADGLPASRVRRIR